MDSVRVATVDRSGYIGQCESGCSGQCEAYWMILIRVHLEPVHQVYYIIYMN